MSEAATSRMSSAIDAAKKAPGQAWYKSKSLWAGLITATFINQFADLAIERVTGLDITDWGYKAAEAMDYNAHKPVYQEVDEAFGISETFHKYTAQDDRVSVVPSASGKVQVMALGGGHKNPEGVAALATMLFDGKFDVVQSRGLNLIVSDNTSCNDVNKAIARNPEKTKGFGCTPFKG